jgi:GTP-binding protein
LRHIERTRLILHVIDISTETGRDPLKGFDQINEELSLYDPALAGRPQIVALNKIDLVDQETADMVRNTLQQRGYAVFLICAPIGEGVTELMQAVAAAVQKLEPVRLFDPDQDNVIYRYEKEPLFAVSCDDGVYRVTGNWIENLVRSTNFDQHESLQYFQRLIRRKGVIEALEKAGVKEGDLVALHDFEFEYFT